MQWGLVALVEVVSATCPPDKGWSAPTLGTVVGTINGKPLTLGDQLNMTFLNSDMNRIQGEMNSTADQLQAALKTGNGPQAIALYTNLASLNDQYEADDASSQAILSKFY